MKPRQLAQRITRTMHRLLPPEVATVQRVIDGDTIVLTDGRKVRYIGIDAPELKSRRSPRTQPYARAAQQRNHDLVADRTIRLVRDQCNTDRYGRLLRYVYIGTIQVNAQLVKEGLARVQPYAPNIRYQHQFTRHQRRAQRKKRGIWHK